MSDPTIPASGTDGSGQVGIVLLSHSGTAAAGVAELAGQVAGAADAVLPAGGTDDGRLGTSAEKLRAAVAALAGRPGSAGVLVLPDLGSAVLTARAFLAGYDGDTEVVLADGPFLEGAVAAAVTASTGADLAAVRAAAEQARDIRKF